MTVFDNMQSKIEDIKTNPFYDSYLKEIENTYKTLVEKGPITLTYQDFMIFYENGSRSEYEKKFFEKREFLACDLALYMIYEDEEYLK